MSQYLCVFLLILLTNNVSGEPIIQINAGLIKGIINYTKITAKEYSAFLGIPFAKAPLNNLRFLPPESVEPWEGILDTQQEGKTCMQATADLNLVLRMSENCLYLNVYTPSLNKTNLPVLVYIHGGAFILGSSRYDLVAPDYFLENDIVFVSLNYRLGIFGFYSTEDIINPGNAGIKDQILALKWIQENIGKFGGNSENVTLMGQSAGAASVSFLMQTSQTKDLFQRAILHSGSSLNSWALARYKRQAIFHTAQLLGIDTNDSAVLLEQMQRVPSYDLLVTSLQDHISIMAATNPLSGLLFSPSIEPEHEGAVITGESYKLLENGDFQRVPSIVGFNSLEFGGDAKFFSNVKQYLSQTFSERNVSKFTPVGMNVVDASLRRFIGDLIATRYSLKYPLLVDDEYIAVYFSEDQFTRAIIKLAELQSVYAPVYLYNFSYLGDCIDHEMNGPTHSEELNYIFSNTDLTTERDVLMKDRLIRMWTNFIKTSNPTPNQDPLLQNLSWPLFNVTRKSFLNIGQDLTLWNTTEKNFKFWKLLFYIYGNPPFDTY